MTTNKKVITVFTTEQLLSGDLEALKAHKTKVYKYWCKIGAAVDLRESDE